LNPRSILSSLRYVVAIAIAFAITKLDIQSLEAYLYDLRFQLRPNSVSSQKVEVVLTGKETTELFKRVPNISEHRVTLERILNDKPLAVVYITQIVNLAGTPEEKASFADLLSRHPQVIQGYPDFALKDEKRTLLAPPFQNVMAYPAPFTRDRSVYAKDDVTRRVLLSYADQKTIHWLVASQINPEVIALQNIRGRFFDYEADQTFIDFVRRDELPKKTFLDVFNQSIPAGHFKDKVVVIGDDLWQESSAYVRTPYDRSVDALTLTEMHANMIDSLIRNSAPIKAARWFDLLINIVMALLTVNLVFLMRPLNGLFFLVGMLFSYSLVSYLAFWPFGFWLPMANPFLTVFLTYYFFIPYRLIVENRRSWEYYQKNKLLSEVEELKTNFIGMMSHDLKTPLARIQGMADVITQETTPLSPSQVEAVDSIRQSANDLVRFISTILNYAKIESEGVQLHLQPKDINQMIKEIVKKYEFLAKLRHIKLITELEPLFSINVDSELLNQAISNLVENAIKYSPDHSKVLISTEENNGSIQIQVADQGSGISQEDLKNIFTKFFRSKEAKTSTVKGSGLGLYLSKYFVELHKGSISVESSEGQGSTFTVELPVGL
jgi:signal transduction histidine kinase